MKKMTWKPAAACTLSLALLAGCGAPAATTPEADSTAAGTVLLSVNPETEVEYDHRGLVLEIEGRNDDGKSVAASYTDYVGRSCEEVVNELVKEIYEAGYFQESVGGRAKNIVIKLEEGSAYPDNYFLEDVARGVRDAVSQCGVDSKPMTVEETDLDDQGHIGLDKAKELVLGQLGLSEASFTQREYELDDGVYELEFTSGGVEYEYEVNAFNGKVLEADYVGNDDWDDLRDDDDWDDLDDNDDWDDLDDNDDLDDLDDLDDNDALDDQDDNDDWDDQDDTDDWDDQDDTDDWDDQDDTDDWDDQSDDSWDDDNDDWDDNSDDSWDDDNDDWDDNSDDSWDDDDDSDDWDDGDDDDD